MRNITVGFLLIILLPPVFSADIDKVYHPYVMPMEREFEWRLTSRQSDKGNELFQRLAYGHALSEFVTVEAYLVGERDVSDNFGVASYEIETRWMLAEQGQYWLDTGLLFELEKAHEMDAWEFAIGLLNEKELGKTSLTTNLFVVHHFGSDNDESLSAEFRLKYRYRWRPEVQPAIEFYTSKAFTGIGPAFMGIIRLNGQQQIKWESAFITGLNGNSKDHSLRFAIEYEF